MESFLRSLAVLHGLVSSPASLWYYVSGGMHILEIFELPLRRHSGTLFQTPCTYLKYLNSFFGGVVEVCLFKVSSVVGDLSGGPRTTRLLWAFCLLLYLDRSP